MQEMAVRCLCNLQSFFKLGVPNESLLNSHLKICHRSTITSCRKYPTKVFITFNNFFFAELQICLLIAKIAKAHRSNIVAEILVS